MTRKFRISRKEKKAIEEAVTRAESHTSGEIVPMIVRQSHNYWWVHWYWAGLFSALVSAALWWATSDQPWALLLHEWLRTKTDYTFWNIRVHDAIALQISAAFFGFGIAFFEPIKRMVLPKKWTSKQVHSAALANFMACGLTETRDRTGVLIFISHLEHQVEIVADKGINEKVPAGFWKQQADLIVKGIHNNHAPDAIIKVILATGEMLSQNYPRRADDTNELSNSLQMGGYANAREEQTEDPSEDTNADAFVPPAAPFPEAKPLTTTEEDELVSSDNASEQFAVDPPRDFPRELLEDEDLQEDITNPGTDIETDIEPDLETSLEPEKGPSDSPLGELDLEEEDTHTNFNIGELPSIHLEDSSPFIPKKKKDDD